MNTKLKNHLIKLTNEKVFNTNKCILDINESYDKGIIGYNTYLRLHNYLSSVLSDHRLYLNVVRMC